MQGDPTIPVPQSKDDLLLLYGSAQEWVRHYQSIIMKLNTWVITFNAAIITFVVTSYFQSAKRPAGIFYALLVPIGMSLLVIITNGGINRSMREGFRRIVQIEDLVGLFDLTARDGTPLLPEHLKRSADVRWPQIFVWLVVNIVVILACSLLISYFYYTGIQAVRIPTGPYVKI